MYFSTSAGLCSNTVNPLPPRKKAPLPPITYKFYVLIPLALILDKFEIGGLRRYMQAGKAG